MKHLHRSEILVELGSQIILKNGEVLQSSLDLMIYDNRCPKCNAPMEPGKEEKFQKATGTCFDCTPGYNALELAGKKSLSGYFYASQLNEIRAIAKDCDPTSEVETKFIEYKGMYQVTWRFDPAIVYERKKFVPKARGKNKSTDADLNYIKQKSMVPSNA